MSGANQHQAGRQAAALLRRSQPGARRSVIRHVRRAEHIGAVIWRRWHLLPGDWQVKHLRWYLSVETRDLAPSSRYDDWLPRLRGPWLRPTGDSAPIDRIRGGRPSRLSGGPSGRA